jgi:ATP-dependent RNA helicase RhlE
MFKKFGAPRNNKDNSRNGRSDYFKRRDGGASRPSFPASRSVEGGEERAPREARESRDSRPSRPSRPGNRPASGGSRPYGGPKKSFGKKPFGRGQRPKSNPREFEASETGGHEPVRQVIQRSRAEVAPPAQESTQFFNDFNLPEELEAALDDAGFERPTPIQEQSLPHTLGGFDLIGCAQTGTGKTAAFVIPMITRLLEDEESQALVLAPTRELAAQILDTLRKLTTHTRHLKHTLIVGGSPYNEQVRALRQRPRILVATPGRLVDHLQQKTINLQKVKFFVLDEADRMFDMGFAPQLNQIVKQLPADRQTLLFSATFEKQVKALAMRSLKNPKEVFVGAPSRAASGVEQEIVETTSGKKFSILLEELNKREGTILLFTSMKYKADKLSNSLAEYGHSVTRIHGGRTMGQRKAALKDFRDQKVRILVATDVAARGLDISHVAHVINYDLPNDPEDYIHRIGRTARAGAVGKALSFVIPEEKDSWKKISRLLAQNR